MLPSTSIVRMHSNTKMDLVCRWFGRGDEAFPLFDTVAQQHSNVKVAIDRLLDATHVFPDHLDAQQRKHDPSATGWCHLGAIAQVLQSVTDALLTHNEVTQVVGTVTALHQRQGIWEVAIEGGNDGTVAGHTDGDVNPNLHRVDAVVLATGAAPRHLPVHPGKARVLHCETALDASQLVDHVNPGETVGVVGNSHSGALVTMNLVNLGVMPRVYALGPVRLAKWESPPGQYLYSATGLKGIAAAFARDQMERASRGEPAPLIHHHGSQQLAVSK